MALREVNGNWFSENGWPLVDEAGCDTNPVPGTQANIPLQSGIPNVLMKAFAGRLNVYIESLNNDSGYADEGGWTESNSVLGEPGKNDGSNHLGGTAMDLNWNDHPMGPQVPDPAAGWQWSAIVGGPEEPRVRELLAFYTADDGTQLIWWGNDWDDPHDSMHFQMGYGTYLENNSGPNPAVQRWINAHIDVLTGMDDFAPGVVATPPAATVLALATGLSAGVAATLLPNVTAGLIASDCNTVNRIAMWLAQIGEESAGFTATVEIGDIDGTTYQGRTWIQITGQSNYASFSKWAYSQGLVSDPAYFVNDPAALGLPQWEAIGPAWYWTVARPQINGLCDNGDVVGVTQVINGGQNGIADRTARWNQALAQGDSLLALISTGTTGGFLMALTDDEQTELLAKVRYLFDQAGPKLAAWNQGSSFGVYPDGTEMTQRDGLIADLTAIKTAVAPKSTGTLRKPKAPNGKQSRGV